MCLAQYLLLSTVKYCSELSHGRQVLGHALLLGPYASLETLNEVDKVLDGAVAQVLNPLKGGFKEAVGHFIPGKDI